MKKIFTILFLAGFMTTAFAQGGRNNRNNNRNQYNRSPAQNYSTQGGRSYDNNSLGRTSEASNYYRRADRRKDDDRYRGDGDRYEKSFYREGWYDWHNYRGRPRIWFVLHFRDHDRRDRD